MKLWLLLPVGLLPLAFAKTSVFHQVITKIDQPLSKATNEIESRAVDVWVQKNDCYSRYFDVTPENLNVSGFKEHLRDSILELRTDPDAAEDYARYGDYRTYARNMMNLLSFECEMDSGVCRGGPARCEDVVHYFEERESFSSVADLLDKSRKVWFSLQEMQRITGQGHSLLTLLHLIETNAGLGTETLITRFTPQPNKRADAECELHKTLEAILVNFYKMAAMLVLGLQPVTASTRGMNFGAIQTFELDTAVLLKDAIPKYVHALTMDRKRLAGTSSIGALVFDITPEPASPACFDMDGQFEGAGTKDENAKRVAAMKGLIAKVTSKARDRVANTLNDILLGRRLENSTSVPLYDFISGSPRADRALQAHTEAYLQELTGTQVMEDLLITLAMQNSHCYQKCSCAPDGSALALCTTREGKALYRSCPPDPNNCACQVECWKVIAGKWDLLWSSSHVDALYGQSALSKYELTIEAVMNSSYENYRKTHNDRLLTSEGLVGSLVDRFYEGGRAVALPTCASGQVIMGDYRGKGWVRGVARKFIPDDKYFPCTCGDWRSNETALFMDAVGMGIGSSDYRAGTVKDIFTNVCPRNLLEAKLPPLSHYLAYCALGMRWPQHGDHKLRPHLGTDSRCSLIQAETDRLISAGKTEMESNVYFCEQSGFASDVFRDEKRWIDTTGFPISPVKKGPMAMNHQHQCKRFLRHKEGFLEAERMGRSYMPY